MFGNHLIDNDFKGPVEELRNQLAKHTGLNLLIKYFVFKELYDIAVNARKIDESVLPIEALQRNKISECDYFDPEGSLLQQYQTSDLVDLRSLVAFRKSSLNHFQSIVLWGVFTAANTNVTDPRLRYIQSLGQYFTKGLEGATPSELSFSSLNVLLQTQIYDSVKAEVATVVPVADRRLMTLDMPTEVSEISDAKDVTASMEQRLPLDPTNVTYFQQEEKQIKIFAENGKSATFSKEFLQFLFQEIVTMEKQLRRKKIISKDGLPTKAASDSFLFALKFFERYKKIAPSLDEGDSGLEWEIINNLVKKLTGDVQPNQIFELYQCIELVNEVLTKIKSSEFDLQRALQTIKDLEDQSLRHEMLRLIYREYFDASSEDCLFYASEKLYGELNKQSDLWSFELKICGREILYQIDDLFLKSHSINPNSQNGFSTLTTVPTQNLIDVLSTTAKTIQDPSFDNINRLCTASAAIGKYPIGSMFARSLICFAGLALMAVSVGIALGCPPLGVVSAALGGVMIATAVTGAIGLGFFGLGLFSIKSVAHKESEAVIEMKTIQQNRTK